MPTIGANNVTVTKSGLAWDITFVGALAKTNVNALQVGTKSGGLTVTISTLTSGVAAVTNGYLVANGGISAYVGSKGNDLNLNDQIIRSTAATRSRATPSQVPTTRQIKRS